MTVRWALALASASVFFCAFATAPAGAADAEPGTDRPGFDYTNFDMEPSIAGFASCQSKCVSERRCVAWTFVKSGVQGPKAKCYLKEKKPKRVADKCCVSGTVNSHGCKIGGKLDFNVLDQDCQEAQQTGCIKRLLTPTQYVNCLRAQPVKSSGCMIGGVNRKDIADIDCKEARETGCIKRLLTPQQYQNCLAAQPTGGGGGKTTPPTGGGTPTEWVEMLQLHNADRAMHGTQALTWSSTLAKGAEDWAKLCTKDPKNPALFAHSGFDNGYGENLHWGASASSKSAVDGWYSEWKNYDWKNPIKSYLAGDTDRSKEVRHFTQLVWKDTSKLGCGVATCSGQRYYVCRYQAQGNFNATNPGVLDAQVPPKR